MCAVKHTRDNDNLEITVESSPSHSRPGLVILIQLLNLKHLREVSQAHTIFCFIHKNRIVGI